MNSTTKPPQHWGKDLLSEFIDTAHHNIFATFNNLPNKYKYFEKIHCLFKKAIDNSINTPEWFAVFFLLKAHSSYLGSVRLALSGQCAETYMVLRGCLESALYGLYLSHKKECQDIWLQRHKNEDALKRVRKEFRYSNLIKLLDTLDSKSSQVMRVLYERTIDYGAHPNELALTSLLKQTEEDNSIRFNLHYLTCQPPSFDLCLKTTAQVGACVLGIFENIFTERFEILGISNELEKLRKDL